MRFFGTHFLEKSAFCLLAPPKHLQNIFLKTPGTRLGVIVAPNTGFFLLWGMGGSGGVPPTLAKNLLKGGVPPLAENLLIPLPIPQEKSPP